MKKYERIAAGILTGMGLAVLYHSYAVLRLGSIFSPDAGFFPFLAGCALILLGCCWLLSVRGPETQKKTFFQEGQWLKPVLAFGFMLVYAYAIESVGYVLSTLLFMIAWQRIVERERWAKTFLIACASTTAMYSLFVYLLKVPLPPEFFLR
ncbi:MAG: tripartite tricarboxylate transporter TctB family protein [Deltaproteobacteria bacterium]|nr:tripartite tricarboxylate transporter TctB family protein [Deltaproteobacteria bacterium]